MARDTGAEHGQDPAGAGGRAYGDIHIGNVRGGVVGIGDHNHIVNVRGETVPCDPAYQQLLEAVRQLATDLDRLVESPAVSALADELSEAEDEIRRTGAAAPGRLTRLRALLQDASASIGVLASGVALGQTLGALLGG
ncbi:hypothetical protein ACWY4P_30515 [Streptomyces sp. LZ34]